MTQYAMVIDLNRCVGCHACALACRAEWQVPVSGRRNWVRRMGPEKTPHGISYTFYPGLCNHCDHPKCLTVCPVDPAPKVFKDIHSNRTKKMDVRATFKDPFTGVVLIDKERCIGCGACVEACPYGARWLNEELEDPKADVHKLVKSGKAKRLVTSVVNIGPNVYYMGHEKDLWLLHKKYAPRERTWENVLAPTRRKALYAAVKGVLGKV